MSHCSKSSLDGSSRPSWLKKRVTSSSRYFELNSKIRGLGLHTVCSEACCPNQAECYSSGTSTFMILGDQCTRNCRFCAVHHDQPTPVNPKEPETIARTIQEMGLKYAVITSVSRDDLEDGGAAHFSNVITTVRETNPEIMLEVLVPDFQGKEESIVKVVAARPEVLNHNVETVPRLYNEVRPQANYRRTLEFFRTVRNANPAQVTKSGLMLGLGERNREVEQTLYDLADAGCDILTVGQYLAPSKNHYPVSRYVKAEEFAKWEKKAREIGFKAVVAGPFVRSSYNAHETYVEAMGTDRKGAESKIRNH